MTDLRKAAEAATSGLDVARKLKETLHSIVNHESKHRTNAYYGGVLVDTVEGPKLAYLRLTFEDRDAPVAISQDVAALTARVEALEKALKPFADKARLYNGMPEPKYFGDTDFELRHPNDKIIEVPLGDLRRAAAAMVKP